MKFLLALDWIATRPSGYGSNENKKFGVRLEACSLTANSFPILCPLCPLAPIFSAIFARVLPITSLWLVPFKIQKFSVISFERITIPSVTNGQQFETISSQVVRNA